MKITIAKLKSLGACAEGIEWVRAQKSKELSDLVEAAIKEPTFTAKDGGEYKTFAFANWGLTQLMTKPQAVRYACHAARLVLGIYEDKHPGDPRPRLAIEAAEKFAENPSEENRQAAWAAEAAAWAGADAGGPEVRAKILRYGVELVEGGEMKSIDTKALESACRKLARVIRCDECLYPNRCKGKISTPCAEVLAAHFRKMARQGRKKK